jgi:tRNA-splicing ligase RtcB (3'-phosphate/5'-hydroxy nucleic acid ligase)
VRSSRSAAFTCAQSPRLLSEEASEAYKDVAQIIEVLDGAGIAMKVCRMRPLGVIKD